MGDDITEGELEQGDVEEKEAAKLTKGIRWEQVKEAVDHPIDCEDCCGVHTIGSK